MLRRNAWWAVVLTVAIAAFAALTAGALLITRPTSVSERGRSA